MAIAFATKLSAIALTVGGVLWVVSQALQSLTTADNTLGI